MNVQVTFPGQPEPLPLELEAYRDRVQEYLNGVFFDFDLQTPPYQSAIAHMLAHGTGAVRLRWGRGKLEHEFVGPLCARMVHYIERAHARLRRHEIHGVRRARSHRQRMAR